MKNEEERTTAELTEGLFPAGMYDSDKCYKCGNDLGSIQSIAICDDCDGKISENNQRLAADEANRRQASLDAIWQDIAGKYGDTTPELLPFEAERSLVARWKPSLRFGATIMRNAQSGPSGRTRTLWALCRKSYLEGKRSSYYSAAELRHHSMALARHGESASAIRELIKTPVLAIDDFGLQAFTPTSCELFALILDKRAASGRPTLIGCPTGAKGLSDLFAACNASATGSQILRRIGSENSWILDLENQNLKTPTR